MKISHFRKKIVTGPFELWKRWRNPLFWTTVVKYKEHIAGYRWKRGVIIFKKPRNESDEEKNISLIVFTWLTTGTEAEGGVFDEEELESAPCNVYGCGITLTDTEDGYPVVRIENV